MLKSRKNKNLLKKTNFSLPQCLTSTKFHYIIVILAKFICIDILYIYVIIYIANHGTQSELCKSETSLEVSGFLFLCYNIDCEANAEATCW